MENLAVSYGHVKAVHDVSLTLNQGETVSLTGPNGAGKSSTLLAIAGAEPVAAGRILLGGQNMVGTEPEAMARAGISLVPEGRHIFTRLTVLENLHLGTSSRQSRRDIKRDFDLVFEHFPVLAKRQREMAGNLSGGEQQMLAIGRALMSHPAILMLDEPSLGLAPKIIDQVYEIIGGLKSENISFLIVEENLNRALEFAERIYVLSSGQVSVSGTSEHLRDCSALQEDYFGVEEGDAS